jgi:hypothetical protein
VTEHDTGRLKTLQKGRLPLLCYAAHLQEAPHVPRHSLGVKLAEAMPTACLEPAKQAQPHVLCAVTPTSHADQYPITSRRRLTALGVCDVATGCTERTKC